MNLNTGAGRIWVGDNLAGVPTISLEDYLRPTGVVEAAGYHFVNPGVEVFNLPLRSRLVSAVAISSLLREADVILNLTVFKTHGITIITGAIKNTFGIIPGGHKTRLNAVAKNGLEFANSYWTSTRRYRSRLSTLWMVSGGWMDQTDRVAVEC